MAPCRSWSRWPHSRAWQRAGDPRLPARVDRAAAEAAAGAGGGTAVATAGRAALRIRVGVERLEVGHLGGLRWRGCVPGVALGSHVLPPVVGPVISRVSHGWWI